jgi:putative transposase
VKKNRVISLEERVQDEAKSYLEKLLSAGARKMLQAAIENEMAEYLEKSRERRTEHGQRAVVRNGYHPERELVTGIGPIKIEQPRVRHRDGQKFSSAILPPYLRRVPSIDALIPALYLKGYVAFAVMWRSAILDRFAMAIFWLSAT